ncbi:1167_t:CDS:1, partial [Funneliformis geosporum]
VKTERSRYAKELQKYWQGVIKERSGKARPRKKPKEDESLY